MKSFGRSMLIFTALLMLLRFCGATLNDDNIGYVTWKVSANFVLCRCFAKFLCPD